MPCSCAEFAPFAGMVRTIREDLAKVYRMTRNGMDHSIAGWRSYPRVGCDAAVGGSLSHSLDAARVDGPRGDSRHVGGTRAMPFLRRVLGMSGAPGSGVRGHRRRVQCRAARRSLTNATCTPVPREAHTVPDRRERPFCWFGTNPGGAVTCVS